MSEIEKGFLLTRESHDHGRHTEIVLWVATCGGAVRLVIEGERPVFLVLQSQQQRAQSLLQQAGLPHHCQALSLTTFQHLPVTAFYFSTLAQARSARATLQSTITLYEADIRLHDRYLMERFIQGGLAFTGQPHIRSGCRERQSEHLSEKLREYRRAKVRPCDYRIKLYTVSLDVECSAEGELYSVALSGDHRSNGRSELVIMIGEPSTDSDGMAIRWVADEAALLTTLVEQINGWDPDVIIGWNVINFDMRLLIRRAELHDIALLLGRGHGERQKRVRWRDRTGERNQGFVTVPGRVVIDGIESLRATSWHFDSFSLEAVAQDLLGRGKATEDVDNRMATITHDFHHNKVKLARYNLEDCRLVEQIFERTRLLDYLCLRSQLTGLELDRLGGSVAAFTNLYLPRLHRAGYIAPNLPADGGLASPGGYVMNSIPGLYDNVLVLDFKSLYPAIIRTFLVDPMGLIEGLSESEREPDSAVPGYRGAMFSRSRHFLPGIIESLWRQRDEAKRARDQARSQALKIIMNSFYGVLGSGGCRFYDTRLASSITLRGHDIMQQTSRWIGDMGYQVIYGDTDSIFVHLGDNYSRQQADNIGRELQGTINSRWRQLVREHHGLESYLELEYETLYSRFLMPTIRGAETGSKKRYAGLKWLGGGRRELVFKGLETVRSDWTTLAKKFQMALFDKVFAGESPEALVRQFVQETLAGERDHDLVYCKRLRRPLADYVKNIPPHVKAARRADDQNQKAGRPLRYQDKGRIRYVMTLSGPEAVEWQQSLLDYQYYVDHQLRPVAEGILPFVGLHFGALTDGQQGLF